MPIVLNMVKKGKEFDFQCYQWETQIRQYNHVLRIMPYKLSVPAFTVFPVNSITRSNAPSFRRQLIDQLTYCYFMWPVESPRYQHISGLFVLAGFTNIVTAEPAKSGLRDACSSSRKSFDSHFS